MYINNHHTTPPNANMQLTKRVIVGIVIIATLTQSVSARSNYCNATFYGQVQVESKDMCNYINYHIFMLMFCGILSVSFMVLTAMHIACNSDPETIEKCMALAISFFLLTMGFEGPYIALTLLFLSLCLSGPVSACARCMKQAADALQSLSQRSSGLLRSVIRPMLWWSSRTAQVHVEPISHRDPPLEEVVVESSTTTTTEEVVGISIIQVDDTVKQHEEKECPICLESSGDSESWFTTKCNHSFHLACINKCVADTCPLCRGPLFYS